MPPLTRSEELEVIDMAKGITPASAPTIATPRPDGLMAANSSSLIGPEPSS
jgi:hypothetical protein